MCRLKAEHTRANGDRPLSVLEANKKNNARALAFLRKAVDGLPTRGNPPVLLRTHVNGNSFPESTSISADR